MRVAKLDRVKWVAIVLAVGVLAVGAGAVLGEEKRISGTQHDVASPDTPVCVYCHLPKDPDGEPLLAAEPGADNSLTGLKNLCFSCHDGTVTSKGLYVFNPARTMHFRRAGVSGQDCDRCHDPHESGYGKFLRLPGGASFCENCHWGGEVAGGHPVDVNARDLGVEPADSHWDPAHGDYSGTRLWNPEGTEPGDLVKCLTCHTTHGGEPDTLFHVMPLESTDDAPGGLCLNCHFAAQER